MDRAVAGSPTQLEKPANIILLVASLALVPSFVFWMNHQEKKVSRRWNSNVLFLLVSSPISSHSYPMFRMICIIAKSLCIDEECADPELADRVDLR